MVDNLAEAQPHRPDLRGDSSGQEPRLLAATCVGTAGAVKAKAQPGHQWGPKEGIPEERVQQGPNALYERSPEQSTSSELEAFALSFVSRWLKRVLALRTAQFFCACGPSACRLCGRETKHYSPIPVDETFADYLPPKGDCSCHTRSLCQCFLQDLRQKVISTRRDAEINGQELIKLRATWAAEQPRRGTLLPEMGDTERNIAEREQRCAVACAAQVAVQSNAPGGVPVMASSSSDASLHCAGNTMRNALAADGRERERKQRQKVATLDENRSKLLGAADGELAGEFLQAERPLWSEVPYGRPTADWREFGESDSALQLTELTRASREFLPLDIKADGEYGTSAIL